MKGYVLDYIDENEFRKLERALKKYNMLAFKKLNFEYYPALRNGKFVGELISQNKKNGTETYELKLPSDKMFAQVHGEVKLVYTVYKKEETVMLDKITSQRDINIAFINELAMAFDKMGIDTNEVIDAMNTKWNALGFRPGLVGGHCIGVDPYYFIYQAEKLGYHSQIISAGRKVNDGMGEFVANNIIKQLIKANKVVRKSKVVILGITFKENCPDTRNSKVVDIINALNDYCIEPIVVDPIASATDAEREYGVCLESINNIQNADCIVFAVNHNEFKNLTFEQIDKMFTNCPMCEKVIIDVKGILSRQKLDELGYSYWRL